MPMQAVQIDELDSVAVVLRPIKMGETVHAGSGEVTAREDIPTGHKIALRDMAAGERAIKYGLPIGHLTTDIRAGSWVHTWNLESDLSGASTFAYEPDVHELEPVFPGTFRGFRRSDGGVGIRNELWIIPTVGCVDGIARELAVRAQGLVRDGIEAVRAFEHPFGCSQTGDDLEQTGRVLAGLARHPNAGGVLVLSLGCEELTLEHFKELLGPYDEDRIAFVTCQDESDELAAGMAALERLAVRAAGLHREEVPASELVVGLECGASDGLSGITANPVIGRVSDALVACGGTSVLAEVPEMFGGEPLLLSRCRNERVFAQAAGMIADFKTYLLEHGASIDENPSPGNREGGITTLEEKSCGCIQKGGPRPCRALWRATAIRSDAAASCSATRRATIPRR